MATLCKEVRIDCLDDHGRVAGVIRVVQMNRDSASIRTLSRQEAKEHGEHGECGSHENRDHTDSRRSSRDTRTRRDWSQKYRNVKPRSIE